MSDDRRKKITLVMPEPGRKIVAEIGDKPIQTMLITPEGATPGRETPGFFIIQINDEPVKSETPPPPELDVPWLPRQFLSLNAVYVYLREQYGWKNPLRVRTYTKINETSPRDFPVVWGSSRKIAGKQRVEVRVRYLGSFRYWDGRRVDPTKVGTKNEFN